MNALVRSISLEDKYASKSGSVYITGIQAIVRIALERAWLDRASGLKTGGFISGYRGSPLGGLDTELARNDDLLKQTDVHFQPGVNEELGATAVMGSQKFDLQGAGSPYDGVFGIWYGKAPGVDRAADALRQANASGTHRNGGVLALAGDDLLAKSSILAQQSEHFFAHAEIPVFNPADIQDVLDYGLHALELSRYSGLWSGMICLADTMDASAIISVDPNRHVFRKPRMDDPRAIAEQNRSLHLRGRLETEKLIRNVRLPAVGPYVRANGLDGVQFGSKQPRVGFVATGKAYRDLRQALALLGIDEERAKDIGIAIYKVAVSWPLETTGIGEFARTVDKLMVVEHKRALMEPQIKEAFYHWAADKRPQIWGKKAPNGAAFLPDTLELSAEKLVPALLEFLPQECITIQMRQVAKTMIGRKDWARSNIEAAQRAPYFCSGCPHSRSTQVPEGARSFPGIGCHAMSETAGFSTDGQIAMGGEGVLWVGQAAFSNDKHVFANMGDGTYYHSGILAIRQAITAKVPITYKILYNDAVAMTGGQPLDGQLTVAKITRQLEAEGVKRIVVVSENPEQYEGSNELAIGTPVKHRDDLMAVQRDLAGYQGVSALIYDQTCATEKRRRRKRGTYENPGKRLFINERICEDCGDCSVQSNCMSIEPLETDFGRKRKINQSSCNMDFSCVKGFCPSFMWVEGDALRKADGNGVDVDRLLAGVSDAQPAALTGTYNVMIAGIGGMGVTTASAVLAVAAHIEGKNASTLDMTGLAQKGGPVTSHLRFAQKGQAIEGPRVPTASLDLLIASDMLVACNAESLSHTGASRTGVVANSRVAPTAEFVMRQTISYDEKRMHETLQAAAHKVAFADAAGIAEALLGDTIFTNMILIGMASQSGQLPLSIEAIENAVQLNGVAVEANLKAFRAGRILAFDRTLLSELLPTDVKATKMSLPQRVSFLESELTAYQDVAHTAEYSRLVDRVIKAEGQHGHASARLSRTIAENLFKVMAYKDEYEVARLYSDPTFKNKLQEQFTDTSKIKVMLAPPLFSRTDAKTGRPQKRAFGPWVFGMFAVLGKMKKLRGTVFDPFGYTHERKSERALIQQYRDDIELILSRIDNAPYGLLVELARIPESIKGYGPLKKDSMEKAAAKRSVLLDQLKRSAENNDDLPFLEAAE
ncbi:MAG: indolepyruvate ferredoxin oxidoreductase family protein [Stappiaceae bacterium]